MSNILDDFSVHMYQKLWDVFETLLFFPFIFQIFYLDNLLESRGEKCYNSDNNQRWIYKNQRVNPPQKALIITALVFTFHLSEHFLENSEKLTVASGCFFLCSSRQV